MMHQFSFLDFLTVVGIIILMMPLLFILFSLLGKKPDHFDIGSFTDYSWTEEQKERYRKYLNESFIEKTTPDNEENTLYTMQGVQEAADFILSVLSGNRDPITDHAIDEIEKKIDKGEL